MLKRLIPRLAVSLLSLSLLANPFVGSWKLDPIKTAKEAKFKTNDISKTKEQIDYIVYSSNDSLLWFSTALKFNGERNTSHFTLFPDGSVSEEFARSAGKKIIDRIRSKKIDEYSYEIFGAPDPLKPAEKDSWNGKVWVSKDKQTLTIKIENTPGTDYVYFKIFNRLD